MIKWIMEGKMYTIQLAAYEILKKSNEPLKSIEIANRILKEGLIESNAKNPVQSVSQALERNIRMNKGNSPRLEFVETYLGRQIQIAKGEDTESRQVFHTISEKKIEHKEEITISISKDLVDKVKIYQLGTGKETIDEAIASLLRTGLFSSSDKLIEILKREMENL